MRAEIQKLLTLTENQDQVTVKYGVLPQTKGEIAILTRSMLQMMITLSTLIEVPEDHIMRGLTPPIENSSNDEEKEGIPLVTKPAG